MRRRSSEKRPSRSFSPVLPRVPVAPTAGPSSPRSGDAALDGVHRGRPGGRHPGLDVRSLPGDETLGADRSADAGLRDRRLQRHARLGGTLQGRPTKERGPTSGSEDRERRSRGRTPYQQCRFRGGTGGKAGRLAGSRIQKDGSGNGRKDGSDPPVRAQAAGLLRSYRQPGNRVHAVGPVHVRRRRDHRADHRWWRPPSRSVVPGRMQSDGRGVLRVHRLDPAPVRRPRLRAVHAADLLALHVRARAEHARHDPLRLRGHQPHHRHLRAGASS